MQKLQVSRTNHVNDNDKQTHTLHVNERKHIVHSLASPSVGKVAPAKPRDGRDLRAPIHCSRGSALQHLPETFPKTVIQESVQERIQARIGIA